MAKSAARTWPVWLGIGDYNNKFIPMLYDHKEVHTFDEKALADLLPEQDHFDNVMLIDKFAQPSHSKTAPKVVEDYYGKITGELVAKKFPGKMRSADVHAAVYDFANKQTYVAHGIVDDQEQFVKKAYECPFLRFDNDKLWDEEWPTTKMEAPVSQNEAYIPKDMCTEWFGGDACEGLYFYFASFI